MEKENKINIKMKQENFRQKLLRNLYPLIRNLAKKGKNGTKLENVMKVAPQASFHELSALMNNGKTLNFSELKGKKVLIVNTASDCGYTGQYAELQSLYERKSDSLQIIAFPSNDFAEQEKKEDKEIAQFCQLNYGVIFPIAKKAVVLKKPEQHPVFHWLTDSAKNGWNDHPSDWNFAKYLINEEGYLTHYFGPSISPLEDILLRALNNN